MAVTAPIREALCDPGLCSATWQTRVAWLPSELRLHGQPVTLLQPDSNWFDLISNFDGTLRRVLEARLRGETLKSSDCKGLYIAHSELLVLLGRIPGIDPETREHFATLFVTLYRGLDLLFHVAGSKLQETFSSEAMRGFILVLAMNSVTIRRSAQQRLRIAHKREEALRIYTKLAEGPQSPRELCRRFNKLAVSDCLAALQQLQEWGLVTHEDGRWRHTESEGDARRIIETSAIEVK